MSDDDASGEPERHHGYTGGGSGGGADEAAPPEPTHAERARTLLARAGEGTLATRSRRREGFPFASLTPYALDGRGRPVVLVSDLAVHTRNLDADDRASLLVLEPASGTAAGPGGGDRNPLGLGRVTLVGRLPEVGGGHGGDDDGGAGGDAAEVRELYLERHPSARYWVDYPDFSFRRMEVEEVYYVGGFGVMGWVGGEAYRDAEPDPLVDDAPAILEHVNADHADGLRLLARWKGLEGVEEARMTSVDRLGYRLRVRTDGGMRGLRIAFPDEVRTPSGVRERMVEQLREAREAREAGGGA